MAETVEQKGAVLSEPMKATSGKTANGDTNRASRGVTPTWDKLARCLPDRHPDWDYWWKFSGPHIATMVAEAGYDTHDQYEALLFYYHYAVPKLGAAPGPNFRPKWKSPLSVDGFPAEYSFKWNTRSGDTPDVRYTIESLGDYTGTKTDPFNVESVKELMYRLSRQYPQIDLTWFHRLVPYIYDVEKANYLKNGGAATTTMMTAFELLKGDFMTKAYFVAPNRLPIGRAYDFDFWSSAISSIAPASPGAQKVFSFFLRKDHGQALHPAGLAVDCVDPSKARIKFYVQNRDNSFDSVRAMMTMGGTIKGLDTQLEELHELIKIIIGLPADHPSSNQLPIMRGTHESVLGHVENNRELLTGYMYYFDIRPGTEIPDIKLYVPTRIYSKSDAQVVEGLSKFMRERGRGQYVDNYLRILDSVCPHRSLADGNGLHAYVSCAFIRGELSITSYFGPEAYHPNRFAKSGK
ncbi:hypothetical protein FQN54_008445 [Arachnomyces sp. PD_36]|nr:hypothetical protein FQN54_008445 [Arachnomyces sp. PD_36]